MHRPSLLITALLVVSPALVRADWKDDVGYTSMVARLGGATPTGAGIAVTQVEASPSGTIYRPDQAAPEFAGKTFANECGTCDNDGVSLHATTVALNYYGNASSISPGITTIGCNHTGNWINNFLLFGSSSAPLTESRHVQNHSWINADVTVNNGGANDINRRLDLLIQRDGVVAAIGLNNGAGTSIPKNLAPAYNVLAVGLSSAHSSYGPVISYGADGSHAQPLIDGDGRVKPDIVAPSGTCCTSWATPMVAGAAALLLQTEDSLNVLSTLPAAQRKVAKAVLAKCLLMQGATRDELNFWRKGFVAPVTDGSVPLDYRYGAGELNIDNSHRVLTTNAQQNPGGAATVMPTGWNYTTINSGATHQYFLDIPPGAYGREFSVLVTWNRRVTQVGANLTPSLANINLRLFNAAGFVKGVQIDQSVSAIDNVELIVLRPALPGRYLFEITSTATWEYAAAWDVRTLTPHIPPDLDLDGDVDAADVARFAACDSRSRVPVPAGCTFTDFDADGDADLSDFARLQRCFTGPAAPVNPACFP
jgi:hypothetical protein